jgi:mRNA interferase RelE/StbE
MKYSIEYHKKVVKDVKKISHPTLQKIREQIETKLTTHPEIFGKPLRSTHKNFWSLRVGSYRVIYQIQDKKCIVLVIAIGKRESIYEQ